MRWPGFEPGSSIWETDILTAKITTRIYKVQFSEKLLSRGLGFLKIPLISCTKNSKNISSIKTHH